MGMGEGKSESPGCVRDREMDDAIVAISTAMGRAAIGIVRLSGCRLEDIVYAIFLARRPGVNLKDRRVHLGTFVDSRGRTLDEGLLVWMPGPRSYTGEDVVECHCHGNPWILQRLMEEAIVAGARCAEPGEFTKRAFLNGRIDLIQADAVIQMINSDSEQSLLAARRLFAGELSGKINGIRDVLTGVLANLEVMIDFPEESSQARPMGELTRKVSEALALARELEKSARDGERARLGVRVVICGRPNVGKSSLFNGLLGYRRAIVAGTPGTTRDVVEGSLELEGLRVHLQDTAGLRDDADEVEAVGIGIAKESVDHADLVLAVFDGSRPRDHEDDGIVGYIGGRSKKWLGVLNKSDLGIDHSWFGELPKWHVLSAAKGDGLEALKVSVGQMLMGEKFGERLMVTSRWQKEILTEVVGNLERCLESMESGLTAEASAFEMYEALEGLEKMLGAGGREEVISKVFSEFCIGK